jgi:hypothetical protein
MSEKKVYTSDDGKRKVWYDPSAEVGAWTLQDVDPVTDNQVGDVDYVCDRGIAMKWLRGFNLRACFN